MKKIGIAVIILAVMGVAVTAGVFVTRHPETTKVEQKHEKIKKEGKAYAGKYRMNISLDTNNKVLSGTVRATLKNATDDDLKSICVRNWAAAILQEKTNQKKKACKTEIISARIGGHTLEIDKKEDASVLYLSDKNRVLAPARECVTVEFSFRTEIPKQKNRFGYISYDGHEMYQLSFCFPCISRYQKGAWNENPYVGDNDETYVYEAADYEVTFRHPKKYTIAATGTQHSVQDGTTITGKKLREFAAVLSGDFCRLDAKTGSTTISILGPNYEKNQSYYKYSMQLAKEAVRIFSEKIGSYPFSQLKIVHCFMNSAMEYPGLCMIGMPDVKDFRKIDKNSYGGLEAHVPHEIAHQWFYAAIGNDSYKEPWLDEGFCEFCEDVLFSYYANKKLQKKMWSDKYSTRKDMDRWFQKIVIPQSSRTKAINRSVSDYQDKPDEYSNSVYEGGELFLYELWKTMGDKTFFQMLHKYYQTYQFQIVTTDDFLKTVRSYETDKKVERIIGRYIEEK